MQLCTLALIYLWSGLCFNVTSCKSFMGVCIYVVWQPLTEDKFQSLLNFNLKYCSVICKIFLKTNMTKNRDKIMYCDLPEKDQDIFLPCRPSEFEVNKAKILQIPSKIMLSSTTTMSISTPV